MQEKKYKINTDRDIYKIKTTKKENSKYEISK